MSEHNIPNDVQDFKGVASVGWIVSKGAQFVEMFAFHRSYQYGKCFNQHFTVCLKCIQNVRIGFPFSYRSSSASVITEMEICDMLYQSRIFNSTKPEVR